MPIANRLVLAALVLAAASLARAESAVPQLIVHTGRLLNGEDQPASGSHTIKFSIFEEFLRDPTHPRTAVWTDTYAVNIAADGTYQVVLGDTTASQNHTPLTLGGATPDRFLAIEIDSGSELSPRLRLASAPYALSARLAEKAADLECAGCVAQTDIADRAVTNAKIADGTIELAKLKREASGLVTGLDADLLDGFDSSAFAPAAIEGAVTAIKTSVGPDLAGAVKTGVDGLGTSVAAVRTGVDGLGTSVAAVKTSVGPDLAGAVGAVKTGVDGLGTSVAAVKTGVDGLGTNVAAVKTSLGDGAAAKLDRLLARMEYSANCDDFATFGWTSKAQCLRDGRWHLILDPGTYGTPTDVSNLVTVGASFRVTSNVGPQAIECVRIDRKSNNRSLCVGPMGSHPNYGAGEGFPMNLHLIEFTCDTDGVSWHNAYLNAPGYGAATIGYGPQDANWGKGWFGAAACKWWAKF